MQNAAPLISVIIVNYKVKEYVAILLNSISKAKQSFQLEIFVVDNNSADDSVSYLKEKYPEVTYIANKENVGFGRANNQAIKKASGEFTLIINPDTLVREDALEVFVNHMDKYPNTGAVGGKLINPDGSFARECRRSIPDLKTAFFRVLGLDSLFPSSKIFGRRYLGWIPVNQISSVPVISGACMFWRTKLLKELGGFDEDFFMYGEDDDLCFRAAKKGYEIYYTPETSVFHYKGESEREMTLKNVLKLQKGLYLFFIKHYKREYSSISHLFIRLAFYLKTLVNYLGSFFQSKRKESQKILLLTDKKDLSEVKKALKELYSDYIFKMNPKDVGPENKVVSVINEERNPHKLLFEIMEKMNEKNISFNFFALQDSSLIGKSNLITLKD